MTRRALLVASEILGLSGCENDANLMAGALAGLGFTCTRLTTPQATRAGILEALDELVATAGGEDAVVLYYSGHGGRMPRPDWDERQHSGQSPHFQYIVPFDVDDSTADDFRGILTEELTAWQRRLTDRTPNVTTILDCCHSGAMARDLDLLPRAISRSFPTTGAIARLQELPPIEGGRGADTNELAVRLVACRADQSAYERGEVDDGSRHGVFTVALADVLRALGDRRVSWAGVGELVRRRVAAVVAQQRPEIEGPSSRVPFATEELGRTLTLPLVTEGATHHLDAAPFFGIASGDSLRLVPTGDDRTVGTARVERVEGARAILSVELATGVTALPEACDAVPLTSTVPRRAVAVEGPGDLEPVRRLLTASRFVRPAVPGDDPAARIVVDDDIRVLDHIGVAVQAPFDGLDAGPRKACDIVERLARARHLVELDDGQGPERLDRSVVIELATHDDHGRTLRSSQGESLFVGEAVSVTMRNPGPEELYVWLFDIGIAGHITLVTNDAASGHRLGPAGTADDTRVVGGAAGRALGWRDDVPADGPRPEAFVVIVADRQQDLGSLATPADGARGAPSSALDAVLDQVRTGVRELPPERGEADAPSLRYGVETAAFELQPGAKPRLDEPAFELDDTPSMSVRTFAPRAAVTPPTRVAVRLVELAVRRNGALFRASIRVDALVITRAADGSVVASLTTQRFPGVADGDLLPAEDVLLFHGEVHDFVDLALWVWRDDSKGSDLAELFASEVGRADTAGALQVIGGLVVAAPQAAAGVAAVAAVATIVRVGGTLVQAVTRRDIGVYRTSKLAFESYGVGRTPPTARKQAQDIEFAYEVIDVS